MLDERWNVLVWHGGEVAILLRLARERATQRAHGSFGFAHAIGIGPVQNDTDALLHAAGGLGFDQPDRKQAFADQRAFDMIDQAIAELGEGILFQRRDSLVPVLAVLPARLLFTMYGARSISERRDYNLLLPALRDRINAALDIAAYIECVLARFLPGDE